MLSKSVPKRIVGFMDLARRIVSQTPDLTAQEIYKRAKDVAEKQNKKISAAKSPQGSLVATLHKHHKQYGLERRRVGREFHYFVEGFRHSHAGSVTMSDNSCLVLSAEVNARVEALVSLGRFPNKEEAQRDLISIGLDTLLAKLT